MTIPYQAHSDTSQDAAKLMSGGNRSQKDRIYQLIRLTGIHGMTGQELAHQIGAAPGTVSARLRELRLDNLIRKSPQKRAWLFASGLEIESNVWKLPEFVETEADAKRDKAKEALHFVNTMKKENESVLDVQLLLDQLYTILK